MPHHPTRRPRSENMIKLKINGRDITAPPGSTVLEAAQAHGISIPNLCAAKDLTPYGGCRLCLVEIKGKGGYLPACATAVEDGLEVTTDTPRLQSLRRQTLELILSEHPHACLICSEKKDCEEYKSTIRKVGEVTGCVLCSENGRCGLQDVVNELKIERVRWPAAYRNFEVHREDPFFDRNYNLCILCARCVRVCREVRGAAAISVVFRGPQAVVGTSLDRPLIDSGCRFCGACVDVCPTGSLTERGLKGEAPPDERGDTVCPLCSLGCALEVDVKKGRIVSTRPQEDAPVNRGQACVKGRFIVKDVVHTQKRILRPMIRQNGGLVETNWDEALGFVAQELSKGEDKTAGMVVSSQLSLEDQYVAQKFARQVLHTEPWIDFPHRSMPLLFRTELQKRQISLPLNFESSFLASARTILIAGADLVFSHPILWVEIHKAIRQGAKLLIWNSGATALDRRASVSLRTAPGSELSALVFLCRHLMEHPPLDKWSGIPAWDEFKASLETAGETILGSTTALSREDLIASVSLLKEPGPAVFLIGPGLVQGSDTPRLVQMFWNLALLCEARVIPLSVENNERGVIELWPGPSMNGKYETRFSDGPERDRHRALHLAGNLPGLGQEKPADFLVVQGCYRSVANDLADVLLPAATWAETDGTFINAEGRIQKFKRLINPVGEARQDWWIFCRLADKMGSRDFPYQSLAEIADEISHAKPSLHEISARHLKRGRPAFVGEESQSSSRFLPLTSPEVKTGVDHEASFVRPMAGIPDYYRGLDLCEEVRGLKRLREKDKTQDQKQEK